MNRWSLDESADWRYTFSDDMKFYMEVQLLETTFYTVSMNCRVL